MAVAAAALGVTVAACQSHGHPGGLPPGYVYGPGHIAYRWPPPAASGRVDTRTFCQLLIDDYEHLKTAQDTTSAAVKTQIVDGYVTYAPTLEAAAPPAISDAVKTYVGAIAPFIRAWAAAQFQVYNMTKEQLAGISSPAVGQAGQQLISFAARSCNYNLPANSTPGSG